MFKLYKIIICLILITFLIDKNLVYSMGVMENRTKKFTSSVQQTVIWIIEDGFGEYYNNRDDHWLITASQRFGAYFYTKPSISEGDIIFTVIVECAWIHSKVIYCSKSEVDGFIYEYWTYSLFSMTRGDVPVNKIFFLITKTESMNGKREIVYKSTKFFKNYKIRDKIVISFPRNNDDLISWMEPWNYPDAFIGADFVVKP